MPEYVEKIEGKKYSYPFNIYFISDSENDMDPQHWTIFIKFVTKNNHFYPILTEKYIFLTFTTRFK